MFTKKDSLTFMVAAALVLTAYIFMAIDPVANGFGVLTLWIAPPLLLIGFVLPCIAIAGIDNVRNIRIRIGTARHLAGFGVLVAGLITYLLTLEPTASLWDCSEFIACAYKLQVPHTPGTPLSLLVGRVASMFALSDPQSVAYAVNVSSAFFSSLAAFLLYHITYYFAGRVLPPDSRPWVIILASASAGLSLVFSDTFWFSAVEAETYGIACFFLLLLVFLILRSAGLKGPARDRRLVLIAYVAGLGYCIHPMCLLAVALLPYWWLSENTNARAGRTALLLMAGLLLVFAINRVIAIGVFELAFGFDKFFVNNTGLPFNSGVVVLVLMLTTAFAALIRRYPKFRHVTWAVIFLVAGFSPYAMLFIRSNHNPPIDETNPENLPMIRAYMSRESYGSVPLLSGPYFDAQIEDVRVDRTVYHKSGNRYERSGTIPKYRYQKSRTTILPRIYSNDADHVAAYRQWLALKPNELPDFGDNLYFMFSYQLGHMYFRYLLFNFAGRESDRQHADWLRPWDTRHGPNPAFTSKARNQYWMLPLLAGIAGAAFQWRKDRKGFLVVVSLFLITGLILALYLNSPPIEPRERDYIYVASFIAYCIWIGLAIAALAHIAARRAYGLPVSAAAAFALPLLLLWQNYDDHDRAGRTFQVDNARNLLAGCARDAILFTGGDNDTFPLWYLQEVEGFRTDVRVVVLSYLNTDWYINQLRNNYYDSKPFELTLDRSDYLQYGPNDVLYLQETFKEGIDARQYLKLIKEGHKGLRMQGSTGDYYTLLPSRKLRIKRNDSPAQDEPRLTGAVDSVRANVKRNADLVLEVEGNYATKSILAMVDIMVSNGWKRPIYFNFTSLNTAGLSLARHAVQEGNIYRLDPMRADSGTVIVDKAAMHDNLITRGNYENLARPDIHFNYEDYYLRMISPLRQAFNTLALAYLNDGDNDMALQVLQFAMKKVYLPHLNPTFANLQTAELFAALGDDGTARDLCASVFAFHYNELQWQLRTDRDVDPLDRFLAQQSAEMLARLGEPGQGEQLKVLGL